MNKNHIELEKDYIELEIDSPFANDSLVLPSESLVISNELIDKKDSGFNTNYFQNFLNFKEEKIFKFSRDVSTARYDTYEYEQIVNNIYEKITTIPKNESLNFLLFGFIQSGKTDFMIGLVIKVLESLEKTGICFVITSSILALYEQTVNRFKKIFAMLNMDVKILNFQTLKNDYSWREINDLISSDKKIVIFGIKNLHYLEQCNRFMRSIDGSNTKVDRVVILDDEGDSASFDNIKKEDPTTIFRLLRELVENSKPYSSSYISVTATPFAHIMADNDNEMKPDYAYILNPGSDYVGLDYYVNDINEGNPKIVKWISEDFDFNDMESLYSNNRDLIIALTNYLLQCLIFDFNSRELNNRKPRMLVNVNRKNYTHKDLKNILNNIIEYQIKGDSGWFVNEFLKKELSNYYNTKSSNKKLFFAFSKDIDPNKIFEEIKIKILPRLQLILMNSTEESKADTIGLNLDNYEYDNFQIIIGSEKLGRGVTFVDLTTTFLARRAEESANADTVLQQARWLGYRKEYKEITKVFLREELISDYIICNDAVEYFIENIREANENNKTFKSLERFFPIPFENFHGLMPTRKTVADFVIDATIKQYYSNNRLSRRLNNKTDESNLNFFKEFVLNDNVQEGAVYPFIKFSNIKDFNENFFGWKSNNFDETLYLKYCEVFGFNSKSEQDRRVWLSIMQLNKPVYVRLIHKLKNKTSYMDYQEEGYQYRRRMGVLNADGKYNFGSGNYSEDFKNPFLKTHICIDIIPIYVWNLQTNNSDNSTERRVFRARIFVPNESISSYTIGIRGI